MQDDTTIHLHRTCNVQFKCLCDGELCKFLNRFVKIWGTDVTKYEPTNSFSCWFAFLSREAINGRSGSGDEVLLRDRAAGSGLAGRNTQGKQVEQAAVTAGVTVVENYLYAS